MGSSSLSCILEDVARRARVKSRRIAASAKPRAYDAEPRFHWLLLRDLDRSASAARHSLAAARRTLWLPLAAFPLFTAYRVTMPPNWDVRLDPFSILAMMLTIAVAWLVRLARARRLSGRRPGAADQR